MAYFFLSVMLQNIFYRLKKTNLLEKEIRFVAKLGFEPRQTEPESVVLPLHHLARFGYRQSNIDYR